MANGDAAAAAGLPVVPATKDIRLGYDDINHLADAVAGHLTSGGHAFSKITGAATTNQIADRAILTAKLEDRAVTTAKVADKAVTRAQVADKTLTAAQLADKTVGATQLGDKAVTTAKIADRAVTKAQLATAAADSSFGSSRTGWSSDGLTSVARTQGAMVHVFLRLQRTGAAIVANPDTGGISDTSVFGVVDTYAPPSEVTTTGRYTAAGGGSYGCLVSLQTDGDVVLRALAPSANLAPSPDGAAALVADFLFIKP
jgi:hypothetical protein